MHRWTAVLVVVLVGCLPATPSPPASAGTLQVDVLAGPVCPVEREPPDPNCEPRAVAGARIFVQPGDGRDILVAEALSDGDGRATIELPSGDYIVTGGDVEGLMGLPESMTVTVRPGVTVTVLLAYDTGIR